MFGKVNQDSFQDIFSTHFGHDPDRFQPLFSPSRTALDSEGLQSAESLLICQKLLSQQQQQPSAKVNTSRYKTELCRPFQEHGSCKYSEKCQFAHGQHELRSVSRHPKYKTDLCRTYHSSGFCPYGPRCHFIHNFDEISKRREPRPAATPAQPMPPLPMFTSGHRKLSLDLPGHARPQYDSESGYTSSGSSSSSHSPSSFRGDSDSDSGSTFSRAPGSPSRLPVFSTLIK